MLPGRLGSLQAQDVMTRDLVVLRSTDEVRSATSVLQEHHITGAPVVDDTGRLVGLLSINDLLRAPGSEPAAGASADRPPSTLLAHGEGATTWDLFERARPLPEDSAGQRVSDYASTQVTSVTQTAPLVEVARAMCEGHWHRVPVVDDEETLVGIISTMDVLAALVHASDEVESPRE